jgi:hypothetical protein
VRNTGYMYVFAAVHTLREHSVRPR